MLQYLEKQEPHQRDAERRRRRLKTQLERLQRLFEWGDIEEDEYLTKRDEERAEMVSLPVRATMLDLEQATNLLADIQQLWHAATPEEKKAWFRAVFDTLYITAGNIETIKPTEIMWALLESNAIPAYRSNGKLTIRTGDNNSYLVTGDTSEATSWEVTSMDQMARYCRAWRTSGLLFRVVSVFCPDTLVHGTAQSKDHPAPYVSRGRVPGAYAHRLCIGHPVFVQDRQGAG